MTKKRKTEEELPLLIRILHIVRCKRCDEILTSPRSVKWEEGQRCRWARMEAEGTRVYRTNKGPHMKEDVPFKTMGKKVESGSVIMTVQTTLGDF